MLPHSEIHHRNPLLQTIPKIFITPHDSSTAAQQYTPIWWRHPMPSKHSTIVTVLSPLPHDFINRRIPLFTYPKWLRKIFWEHHPVVVSFIEFSFSRATGGPVYTDVQKRIVAKMEEQRSLSSVSWPKKFTNAVLQRKVPQDAIPSNLWSLLRGKWGTSKGL